MPVSPFPTATSMIRRFWQGKIAAAEKQQRYLQCLYELTLAELSVWQEQMEGEAIAGQQVKFLLQEAQRLQQQLHHQAEQLLTLHKQLQNSAPI